MCVRGAAPEPKQYLLALCISNIPIIGIQKKLCWLLSHSGMGVWGATPEPKHLLCVVHFNHPHPRHPKIPLLAYGVLQYGCLRRHPRTQSIFFGVVHVNHPNPRYWKTALLVGRVHWYRCLGSHPRTQTIFFAVVHFKQPHPRYPKTTLLASGTAVWVFGAPTQNPNNMFGTVHFKLHHPRYSKTPLLACMVQ